MGEDTSVWHKVVGGLSPPRKGCSRAILRRQTKNVSGTANMGQTGRGRAGAPVARHCAEIAPQVTTQRLRYASSLSFKSPTDRPGNGKEQKAKQR